MTDAGATPKTSRWRIGWAIGLSLLTPGLGQIYARAWRPGLAFIALNEALSTATRLLTRIMPPTQAALALAATLLLLSLALAAIAAVDAARRQHSIAPERPRWFRSTWAAAAAVVLFGLLTDQALPFGWQSFYIPSGSMMPTLLVGDRFLADIRHPGAMPARGDIVLFVPPSEPGATYIKRVIGLPGDRIALHHGILFINGTALPRQPIAETAAAAMPGRLYAETLPGGRCYTILHQTDSGSANNTPDYAVPASSLFVMGDNRDNSTDSRFSQVGFVPLNTVQGTAGSLFWSPDRTRLFTRIE